MNSSEIHEISNWVEWRTWDARTTNTSPGIYAFRAAGVSVPRVRGNSDILYIGSSLRNLRTRLRSHYRMRTLGSVLLASMATQLGQLEVGWANLDERSAFTLESDLIVLYAKDHYEFPPANNQQPARQVIKLANLIGPLPPNVKEGVFQHFVDKRLGRK